jgi:hypothetical protein
MGATDDATASIRTLADHYREHPVTSAAGHSYTAAGTRTGATVPAAPVNLAVVDLLTASITEVVEHTHQINPHHSPLPDTVSGIYDWYIANTALADAAERQRRDTVVYRQHLEHAIAAGDIKVVRPHRCPECRTFGLMWSRDQRTVVCTNGECLTKDGFTRRVSLWQIAAEHVAAQYENSVRDCAT